MTQVDFEAIHTEHGCVRYWSSLTQMAKQNRKNPTETEKDMWDKFLSNDKTGFRFLRQIGITTIRFTNDQALNNPEYIKSVLSPLVKGG